MGGGGGGGGEGWRQTKTLFIIPTSATKKNREVFTTTRLVFPYMSDLSLAISKSFVDV